MKIRHLVASLVLAAGAVPASAQKVYIDYDRSVDFDQYKTFAWARTTETSLEDTSPLMHSQVKNSIEALLSQGGLTQVESDPELYVTYHTEERDEMRLDTTNWGYGFGGGWGWDPYWDWGPGWTSSTTRAYNYTRGTLILDIWDAEKKELIWRATAEAVAKDNPQKAAKQVDKAVRKMGKKWQKMYGR